MYKKNGLIYGIGKNDYEGSIWINGKVIKSYAVWKDMLRRCYSEKCQAKFPTYIGCSVCKEWLNYSTFKDWFDNNYRWDLDEIGLVPCLDKDLIVEGNKIYSPDTCIFLPNSVNSFLANRYRNNTSGITGVSWDKHINKWKANIRDGNGKKKHLGCFTNIEDASLAYQHARAIRALEIQEEMRGWNYSEDIIKLIKNKER